MRKSGRRETAHVDDSNKRDDRKCEGLEKKPLSTLLTDKADSSEEKGTMINAPGKFITKVILKNGHVFSQHYKLILKPIKKKRQDQPKKLSLKKKSNGGGPSLPDTKPIMMSQRLKHWRRNETQIQEGFTVQNQRVS